LATRLWSLKDSAGLVTSGVLLVLFAASALWVTLSITAPLMVPSDTLLDLTGTVGMRENDAQFESLSVVPRTMYIIGDLECHQIAERSFFLNGNQMPFCSRDLGLFIGLMVGFGIATFISIQVNPVLLILGMLPLGLDGGIQMVTEYESTNALRMATGVLAGVSLALLLALFIVALKDDPSERSASGGPEDSVVPTREPSEG
jgi:uncharacterized membrane protein